jgi:hypothetical protein
MRSLWHRTAVLAVRTAVRQRAEFCEAPLSMARRFSQQAATAAAPSSASPRLCVVRPDLVGEWIPTLNSEDVTQISSTSTAEVHWKCRSCSNIWQSSVRARVSEQAHCMRCAGGRSSANSLGSSPMSLVPSLLQSHPHKAARWDVEKNQHVSPSDVSADSTRRVWWTSTTPGEPSFLRSVAHFVADGTSPSEADREAEAVELALLAEIEELSHTEPVRIPPSSSTESSLLTDSLQRELSSHGEQLTAMWVATASMRDLHDGSSINALRHARQTRLDELVCIVQDKKKKPSDEGRNAQARATLPSFVFDADWKTFFTLTKEEASRPSNAQVFARRRRIDTNLIANSPETQQEEPRRVVVFPDTPTAAEEVILDDTHFIPQRVRAAIVRQQQEKGQSQKEAQSIGRAYPYVGSDADADRLRHMRNKQRTFRSSAALRGGDVEGTPDPLRSAALPDDAAASASLEDLVSDSTAATTVGLTPAEAKSMQYQRKRPVLPRRTRGGFVLPEEAEDYGSIRQAADPQEDRRAAVVAAAAQASSSLPKVPRVIARPRARAVAPDEE